ncbi:transcription initiation factor TFIID subunit 4-like isoform X2 [Lycorma delicatula]|uniref:transcription initiation factor TFIID subunit 4-like isoform X2 n=1 Tax=Lycorma delicatula TaxID=130591 RepID=UPI003F5182AB
MASAKFLEEALSSTDVDESAVNALVGSLEDQLVTTAPAGSNQQGTSVTVNQNHMTTSISNGGTVTTQKHGVSNGGSESMNIIVNNDGSKVIPSASHQSGNSISTSVVNTVVASLQGGVPSSGFLNQVTSNIGLVQSSLTNLNKSQESVKLVYPSSSQAVTTSVGVNINNRVSYANQSSTSLPNGNIGLAAHTGLNASSSSVQSIVTQSYSQASSNVSKQIGGVVGMDQNKPTGTALVIKSSGNNHGPQGTQLATGVVSVPMTVNTTMTLSGSHVNTAISTSTTSTVPGVVTLTKPLNQPVGSQQTIVGNNPTTLIPTNVQILNVNTLRAGTPGQPGQKTLPPRVMIGAPQMVGARPGQPGQITLQTLQGLQPGTQGHLLVKTENGQYQLLRVGPATTPTAAIAPNNAANTAFRVQPVPAVGGTAAGTIQTQVPALSGTTQSTTTPASAQARHGMDTTKEKCRKFLANLLELSSREPKAVERNVRTLIQELVDTKVEPEEFCDRLERLLNASPQPCLIGFLKKSLPLLRQSMVTNELIIEGIRPPPRTVVFSMATSTPPSVVQPQIQQPANQTTVGLSAVRPQVQMTTTPQMRVIAHPGTTLGSTTTRPAQPIQHRIVTPMRMPPPVTKVMTATSGMGTVTASNLRPTMVGGGVAARITTPIRPPAGGTAIIKTPTGTLAAQLKPGQTLTKATLPTRPSSLSTTAIVTSASPINKTHTSSFLLKAVTASKEKEKKSYSSAGYTGDDDINDVAAMGGVNLAEETQRILGSTEFVGTQIRSCKDDLYLHSAPLVQKISQIASRHGLEEPPADVAALVSHATQERLKTLVEKLAVIAEHRIDLNKADPQYEVSQDVRGQLKFLEELDRVERKRHEEQERELLLRAAKSRSKSEDPEQAKLKAKAKEMQRAEMEELRQREANLTALQAIGSRKKPKLDNSDIVGNSGQLPSRPRLKRVNLRDLIFLLEQEKETCRSNLLYRAHLK